MKKAKLKSILLTGMILLNFYLIQQLWFADSWNHNFFTISYGKDEERDNLQYILKPRQIVLNFGENLHAVLPPNTDLFLSDDVYSQFLNTGIVLTQKVLKEGEMLPFSPSEESYINLIGKQSMIFDFDAEMSIEMLRKTLDVKDNEMKIDAKTVGKFDQIIVIPEDNVSKEISFYFIKEDDGKLTHFIIRDENIDKLRYEITKQKDLQKQNYIALFQQFSPGDFMRNGFLPLSESGNVNAFKAPVVQLEPFLYHRRVGEIDAFIKKPYFSVASAVSEIERNGIITYIGSKEKTVILYPTGRLVYKSQEIGNPEAKTDETSALFTGISFMQDKIPEGLQSSLYLKALHKAGNQYIVKFQQHYEGYPVDLIGDKGERKAAIEITIENNIVKTYEQQIYKIQKTEEKPIAGLLEAWDKAGNQMIGHEKMIGLDLTYKQNSSQTEKSKEHMLQWRFTVRGNGMKDKKEEDWMIYIE